MSTQLRKGVLEICVLAMINIKDMYGYEVVDSISRVMEVKESTIYPLLRRLTSDGYFESYIRKSEEGPDRKYYKITNEGKESLKNQVKEWDRFVYDVNYILESYRKEYRGNE
ncbi:PadR family transcriptional regulator [Clostridium frigidicarnis]|uniref:PadR family transcriptional regulator, regulatory protein PadR n=1 Tax=Clostridium frigidicarnis TaxID=84698 RepID=A0A1I0YJ16_9CLOT|nr:PadR family transcriptional regulator [Clostridium frigidicarnis]SFB12318.1 PadR family transcriptional regulator, regulatory protein PadR [Clostridium frigidicarnis]